MKSGRRKNLLLWGLGVLLGMGLAILALVLLSWGINRMENTVPQEEELSRYPDLEVFLPGRTTFRGINHNLDLGEYVFAFKTSRITPEDYFHEVHSAAIGEGWILDASSVYQRTYSRPSRIYPAARGRDIVDLKYDPESKEVTFRVKANSGFLL